MITWKPEPQKILLLRKLILWDNRNDCIWGVMRKPPGRRSGVGAEEVRRFDTKAEKLYHARLMSEQAVIDNLEFAGSGKVLQGEIPVAQLSRLRDSLSSEEGLVNYTLAGKIGEKGERLLYCTIEGVLPLQCQRCLEPLSYPLRVASVLKVVRGGSEFDAIDDEDEDVDSIPASSAMSVPELIEEEIILSLPLSPVHFPGSCPVQVVPDAVSEVRTNSFGVLEALKGKL